MKRGRRDRGDGDRTAESRRGATARDDDRTRSSGRKRSTVGGTDDGVKRIQAAAGNRAVEALYERGTLQPNLRVAPPDGKHEREAERVARAVTAGDPSTESIEVAGSVGSTGARLDPDLAGHIRSLRGGGRPLSPSVRASYESAFGRDFGDVRVHTGQRADDAAQSIDAEAFTMGTDVFFAAGNYRPSAREGKQLLAHELTHVVQQSSTNAGIQRSKADQQEGTLRNLSKSIKQKLTVITTLPTEDLPLQKWANNENSFRGDVTYGTDVDDSLGPELESIGRGVHHPGNTLDLNSTLTMTVDGSYLDGTSDDAPIAVRYTYYEDSSGNEKLLIENLGERQIATADAEKSIDDAFDVRIDDRNWDDEELAAIRTALETLSTKVLEMIRGVRFESEHKPDAEAAGRYDPNDHTIYLYDQLFDENASVFGGAEAEQYSNKVRMIVHEIGHAIDFHRNAAKQQARIQNLRAEIEEVENQLQELADGESEEQGSDDEDNPYSDVISGGADAELPGGDQSSQQTGEGSSQQADEQPSREELESRRDELQTQLDREQNMAVTRFVYSSAGDEFMTAYNQDRRGSVEITPYASRKRSQYSNDNTPKWDYTMEVFAESYALYITAPDTLEAIRPNVYEFFEKRDFGN